MNDNQTLICNWCGQPTAIIWVHGHGQCFVCGINIDECCRGEEAHPNFNQENNEENDKND